jgi:F0F1-type ATP synthase assembly protein I
MTDPSLETKLAVISATLQQMRDESHASRVETKEEIKRIQDDVSAMKQQSARWKGGIAVLIAVGGFASWFLDKFAGTFKG